MLTSDFDNAVKPDLSELCSREILRDLGWRNGGHTAKLEARAIVTEGHLGDAPLPHGNEPPTMEDAKAIKTIYLPRRHVPYIPLVFAHTEPGPHSVSNEHVLPYVPFTSNGALTGCWSFLLPGHIPPTQVPYIEPDALRHWLPGWQSVSKVHAIEPVEKIDVTTIAKTLSKIWNFIL